MKVVFVPRYKHFAKSEMFISNSSTDGIRSDVGKLRDSNDVHAAAAARLKRGNLQTFWQYSHYAVHKYSRSIAHSFFDSSAC